MGFESWDAAKRSFLTALVFTVLSPSTAGVFK
jgi:hypothetical protein